MRNAAKRNEFRQLLLSDLDYSNYIHVVNSWLCIPQHNSFYRLTSKPSSSCSFPSSSTSPGVQNLTHFSLPSRLLLCGPSFRQALLSSHSHTLLCPQDSFTLEPSHATLPSWKRLLGAIHADINTSFFSVFPDSLLHRATKLWQSLKTGDSSVPLPLAGCQAPAVPFDLPLLPINRPNEPTTTRVSP